MCERHEWRDSLTRNRDLLFKSVVVLQHIDASRALHRRTFVRRMFTHGALSRRQHLMPVHPSTSGDARPISADDMGLSFIIPSPVFDYIYCRCLMREAARTHVSWICAQPGGRTRTHIIMPKRYSRKRAFAWYIRGYMRAMACMHRRTILAWFVWPPRYYDGAWRNRHRIHGVQNSDYFSKNPSRFLLHKNKNETRLRSD